jgi:hypothetical protein
MWQRLRNSEHLNHKVLWKHQWKRRLDKTLLTGMVQIHSTQEMGIKVYSTSSFNWPTKADLKQTRCKRMASTHLALVRT